MDPSCDMTPWLFSSTRGLCPPGRGDESVQMSGVRVPTEMFEGWNKDYLDKQSVSFPLLVRPLRKGTGTEDRTESF